MSRRARFVGGKAFACPKCRRSTTSPRLSRRLLGSHRFDRHCDALTDADAHRGNGAFGVAFSQFQRRRAGDAGAGHAERVAEGDRAAIGIDVISIVRKAEVSEGGERLAGKSLVQLDRRSRSETDQPTFRQERSWSRAPGRSP